MDEKETSTTGWLTPNDLGSLYDLEYKRYGDETGDPSLVQGWIKHHPFIGKILFNAADRRDVWGAINLIPLQEDIIFRLLKREIRDVDLHPEKDILTYDAPGIYNVYAASVILRPDKREHFLTLLDSVFAFWIDMAPTKQLGRIYARAVSEEGQMLATRLFFSPLAAISADVYQLDLSKKSFSKYILHVQKKIQEKK